MIDLTNITFRSIVEAADDIVIVTDANLAEPGPRILYVNPAFTRLSGYSAAEAVGQTPRILQGPGTDRLTLNRLLADLTAGRDAHETLLNYTKAGAPFWLDMRISPLRDESGTITGFVSIERDVTLDRQISIAAHDVTNRDLTTGIPNATAFAQIMDQVVAVTQHNNGLAPCLAQIDVDKFTHINEQFGLDAGKAVLFGLAGRLAENLRRIDRIGRIARDKFAICMPAITVANAATFSERLRNMVAEQPFATAAGPVKITVSIGVSAINPASYSANDVLMRASQAMYLAKKAGRNRVIINQSVAWP